MSVIYVKNIVCLFKTEIHGLELRISAIQRFLLYWRACHTQIIMVDTTHENVGKK